MKQRIHEWDIDKWQQVVDDINVRIDRGQAIVELVSACRGYPTQHILVKITKTEVIK